VREYQQILYPLLTEIQVQAQQQDILLEAAEVFALDREVLELVVTAEVEMVTVLDMHPQAVVQAKVQEPL